MFAERGERGKAPVSSPDHKYVKKEQPGRDRYRLQASAHYPVEARRARLDGLESQPRAPDRELVARLDHDPPCAAAVDVDAVSRAEVGEDPAAVLAAELDVLAGHCGIG